MGGGGRGVRVAPEHLGTGEWVVVHDRGNAVGEVLMKASAWEEVLRKTGAESPASEKNEE